MNIAVLITCHNRKEKTMRCLRSLLAQTLPPGCQLAVFLVDDGSTDGTRELIGRHFPSVKIIRGSGDLYWNGGMRLAWRSAAASDPDAYFLLNDDVELLPRALATLNSTASSERDCILIGSCRASDSGERTYGGLRRRGNHPGKIAPIQPAETLLPCDTFEGNIVWVPRSVYRAIGMLGKFRHAMGDVDYGYTAARHHFRSLLAPGFLGICDSNPVQGSWKDRSLSRWTRLKKLQGIKGLPPGDWWRFCWRNGGWRSPVYFITPVLRVLAGA